MNEFKPRLELRVGITGHRPPRLKPDLFPLVGTQIEEILREITGQLALIHAGHQAHFSAVPPQLVMVSPLATGADSVAADAALRAGVELEACLPFTRERYRKDFDATQGAEFERLLGAASRVMSLPGENYPDGEAYQAVGFLTMALCDILIAVWDGKPAAGMGGTPEIVAAAIAEHTPVIVIDANGRKPPRLLWSGIEAEPQDSPTLETVPAAPVNDVLHRLVGILALPPLGMQPDLWSLIGHGNSRRPVAYPLLLALTGARTWRWAFRAPQPRDSADQILPFLYPPAPGITPAADADNILVQRFTIADQAAIYHALRYRSGFIANSVMAAFAILLALAGLIDRQLMILFTLAELIVILGIVLHTRRASQGNWHRRWIDARHLAELLRILGLASTLGILSLRRRGDLGEPSNWPGWYARATAREVGMPTVHLSLEAIRDRALTMIDEQRAYHITNAGRMQRVDRWLQGGGNAFFVATILVCLAWLFGGPLVGPDKDPADFSLPALVTMLAALLPALGSAALGIRMYGNFAEIGERSTMIQAQLQRLRLAIGHDPLDHRRLASRLRRLSEIMLSEIEQWRQMSESRPASLPG